MKLLMVAAVSLAVVSCASLSLEDLEFHAWKLKFGKEYRSLEEEARRKDIWLSTRRRVLAHNILADQGIKTYRMGMNHLSDMDQHEYMARYISLPKDFINSTAQYAVATSKLSDAPLPKFVDWRVKGCVTPVRNQGYCGSCWAFSSVGALESHTCIKHGQERPIALSVQQLVDCSRPYGNDGCNFGYVSKAFQYCEFNEGIVTDDFYPYVGKELPCRFTKNNPIPSGKTGARCTGHVHSPQGDELNLQRVVAEKGPVAITIPLHCSFYSYESGVYYEPDCNTPPPNNMHHIMLVVGYGTTENGEDYWLVKNSHGTSWGEAGYIRMARNKNNNCGIADYAFYPVVE